MDTTKKQARLPALFDVPALEIDADRGSLRPQCRVDRRVTWNVLHALAVAGFLPACVDDGCDTTDVHGDALATMELLFDLDEARVTFSGPGNAKPWCKFVFGNDGPDALADYTINPEAFRAALEAIDFDRLG